MPDQPKMTLGEHIEELRRSLIRAVVGVAVGMAICLVLGDQIMRWMCWPIAAAMRSADMPVHLRTLAPAESFSTYFKVCLSLGAILSAPYGLWQIWRFVAAGLYPHEKRYVYKTVPFSVGLFLLGAAFFFVVMAPVCLRYFLTFGQESYRTPPTYSPVLGLVRPSAQPGAATQPATAPAVRLPVLKEPPDPRVDGQMWIDASDGQIRVIVDGQVRSLEPKAREFIVPDLTLGFYMSFVSSMSVVFGLGFQVPIVVLVLLKTGLVSPKRMRSMRKYVVLILLIVAGVMTPTPDVVSQLALATPMYLLFELGLLLGRPRRPPDGAHGAKAR